jgi:Holliday junction resolvase RusA-like endonuclease
MIIEINGTPKAQPRQRHWAKATKGGEVVSGNYDPGTADSWRELVALELAKHAPKEPYLGPVCLEITFLMPRPKAHFRTKGGKPSNILKATAPHFHIIKPDRDNLEKLIMDELKRHGYYKDDGQVCCGPVTKLYAVNKPGCVLQFKHFGEIEKGRIEMREKMREKLAADQSQT